MPRKVIFTKTGPRSQIVTDAHHRAGYLKCGPKYKLWCSCGWKTEGEGHWSAMDQVMAEHKGEPVYS